MQAGSSQKGHKWAILGCWWGGNVFSCLSTSSVCGSGKWRGRGEKGLQSPNQGCCWDLCDQSHPEVGLSQSVTKLDGCFPKNVRSLGASLSHEILDGYGKGLAAQPQCLHHLERRWWMGYDQLPLILGASIHGGLAEWPCRALTFPAVCPGCYSGSGPGAAAAEPRHLRVVVGADT